MSSASQHAKELVSRRTPGRIAPSVNIDSPQLGKEPCKVNTGNFRKVNTEELRKVNTKESRKVNTAPKKKRKPHSKTRTGCGTCRIRRKKCDEGKPACKRCTSTGRICDGYRETHTWVPQDQNHRPQSTVALKTKNVCTSTQRRPPGSLSIFCLSIVPGVTQTEASCYDFFRAKAAPEFAGHFDSQLWSGSILRASLQHPAVFQAVVAIGAVQRALELEINPAAFTYCDIAKQSFSRCVSILTHALESPGESSRELAMMTSVLLCVYELFQCNTESARRHIQSCYDILFEKGFRRIESTAYQGEAKLTPASLHAFLCRMEAQLTDLCPNLKSRTESSERVPSTTSSESFDSFEHAANALFQYVEPWKISYQYGYTETYRAENIQTLMQQLTSWSRRYANYIQVFKKELPMRYTKPGLLLRLYREAAYLILFMQPEVVTEPNFLIEPDFLTAPNDTTSLAVPSILEHEYPYRVSRALGSEDPQGLSEVSEALNLHFAQITARASASEVNIGPPGYGISSQPCTFFPRPPSSSRNHYPHPRKKTTSLVSLTASREDTWGVAGNVAEKLNVLEEESLIRCSFLEKAPGTTDMMANAYLDDRTILIRRGVRSPDGDEYTWTEELVAF